jgi:hypothetical protein
MNRTKRPPIFGGMPMIFPLVGAFLLIFLPALALLIAGLARLAGATSLPTTHRSN